MCFLKVPLWFDLNPSPFGEQVCILIVRVTDIILLFQVSEQVIIMKMV
jgi:hypothetical protein